ncbi:MAG: hypothetical protein N2647_05525 [Thermodesulfovibrio sp.]|nr:hypothetical protein [Thermodesulfovibrio sp.]
MLEPLEGYKQFDSDENMLEKFKQWKFTSEKAKTVKNGFLYKGHYTEKPLSCKVIGYISDYEIVVEFADGKKHKIFPDYLKQMQKKDFSKDGQFESDE